VLRRLRTRVSHTPATRKHGAAMRAHLQVHAAEKGNQFHLAVHLQLLL
jgi:hypothetical protein